MASQHHGDSGKGNSPKVRSPFLMYYSQRDIWRELCKRWSCEVYLGKFHQVSFVPFQWTELACCGWHLSWHKESGVSKALGGRFSGAEVEALQLSSSKTVSLDQVIPWNYVRKSFFSYCLSELSHRGILLGEFRDHQSQSKGIHSLQRYYVAE